MLPWLAVRSHREGEEFGSWDEPDIDSNVWRSAQDLVQGKDMAEWLSIGAFTVVPSSEMLADARNKYVKKADRTKYLNEMAEKYLDVNTARFASYDKFMDVYRSFYLLQRIPASQRTSYVFYHCSCAYYGQHRVCKHVVATALKSADFILPPQKSVTIIGAAKKRGRPRKAKVGDALVVN